MTEAWKPVSGFEGWYSVSSLGRVRRERDSNAARAGVLSAKPDVEGYPQVTLSANGKTKQARVHRLVVAAFIMPLVAGHTMEVNHKNGNKRDNRLVNLEYVTCKENRCHAINLGLWNSRGEANAFAKLSDEAVRKIRLKFSRGAKQRQLATEFGVSTSSINRIVHNDSWRHVA